MRIRASCRLCTRIICVAHVTFAVGEAAWTLDLLGAVGLLLCFLFLRECQPLASLSTRLLNIQHSQVSKLLWPSCAIIPNLHLHHQRTLSSAVNYIYLSQAYLDVSNCWTYIWPIPMVLGRAHLCNDIPRDIPERDPPSTYIHTW